MIDRNRLRFRKSFETLFRGIQQVYFRTSVYRDDIIEIYRRYFYEYIELIFEKIRDTMEKRMQDFTMNTMYNNILNLIVLFFILDYQKISNHERGIHAFIDKIFDIGFSFDGGKGYFHLDLRYVVETIGFDYRRFTNLHKLETPILSILYSKNTPFQYRDLKFDTSKDEPISTPEIRTPTPEITMTKNGKSVENSVEQTGIQENRVESCMQEGMIVGLVNMIQQHTIRNDALEKMILQMKSRMETLESVNQSLVLMNTQLQNVNCVLQKEKGILENVIAERNFEITQKNREIESMEQLNVQVFQDFSPRSMTSERTQSPILDALFGKSFGFP